MTKNGNKKVFMEDYKPTKEDEMVETMTDEAKARIAEMERQKIQLENQLELLGYSGNLVRMHELENEIYEIEDTIRKLLP